MIELVREMTYQLDIDGPAQDVDTSVQSPAAVLANDPRDPDRSADQGHVLPHW